MDKEIYAKMWLFKRAKLSMGPETGHFRITGSLGFVHRLVFKNKRT
jgi:hypothetical protein